VLSSEVGVVMAVSIYLIKSASVACLYFVISY
jgi:hypothetical protein